MRLGRTSAIVFLSKIVVTGVGFVATLYFARVIGSYNLGTYFLLLSTMSIMGILIQAGIGESVVKRMSEGQHASDYFLIGSAFVAGGVVVLSVVMLLFSDPINHFFDHDLGALFLVALVGSNAGITLVRSGLTGTHKVHLMGVFNTLQAILRVGFQVLAVSLGFSVLGLVVGWVGASIIVLLLGLVYLRYSFDSLRWPSVAEFEQRTRSMFEYSKYSWLGSVKSKVHNYADLIILGFFVSNNFIGVYAVCWNIASFLSIFGASIHETLFPEISRLTTDGDEERTAWLVSQSIQYSGMFVIPGLVGGTIIAGQILRLYGSDFTIGSTVLVILIAAILIYDYQKQFTNALNGMDRPELAFRINALFIVSNVILNLLFVSLLGWTGAAYATAISSAGSFVYAHQTTITMIDIDIPFDEIGLQLVSTLVMAIVVLALAQREIIESLVTNQFLVVGGLVLAGVVVYLTVLLGLSADTREIVFSNLGMG